MLIGDTRQHQGVDAGKPFEQMQQAGMRTSQLDQIMRQKDPELLRAVEHFAKNETAERRCAACSSRAASPRYRTTPSASRPSPRTMPPSPKTRSSSRPTTPAASEINEAVRAELQGIRRRLDRDDHRMRVLTQRSDMTSADRSWAARVQRRRRSHYTRGSKEHGIERSSYATVVIRRRPKRTRLPSPEDRRAASHL